MSPSTLDYTALVGHSQARNTLQKGGRSSPYPALIFSGPGGVGKRLTGIWYAAFLNCQADSEHSPCGQCGSCRKLAGGHHPDLLTTRLEEKKTVIGVGEVREVLGQLEYAPFEGRYRTWIVEEAEKLSDEAQNALLKTLEEPPRNALIVLVTRRFGSLIPTVTSRCRTVRFHPLQDAAVATLLRERGSDAPRAELLARLSRGAPGRALELATNRERFETRERAVELFLELPGSGLSRAMQTASELEKLKLGGISPLLEVGSLLFRDLMLLGEGCEELLAHHHRLDDLRRLQGTGTSRLALRALQALAEAEHYLLANVSTRLLLQRLCQRLSKESLP